MKKSMLFLFLTIILNSCLSDSPQVCANVYIYNNSKYNLTLEAFQKGKLLKTILIDALKKNESFINTKSSDSFFGIYGSEIDSVNIKFNSTRIIIQYCNGKNLSFCPDIERNILLEYSKQNNGGSTIFSLDKEKCKVLKKPIEISFDQSDYDRAIPIKN
jgi:hypothetical protein